MSFSPDLGFTSILAKAMVLIAVLVVSACAIKPRAGDAGWRQVAGVDPGDVDTFRVAGRLAVSDGKDGGSAGFLWTQRGDTYEFELRQPVSQRTWRLVGDDRGAVLEGGEDGPRHGASAEALLSEVLGWRIPVRALSFWVRGLSHPWVRGVPFHSLATRSERDDRNRLILLDQDGWQVEYLAWLDDGQWPTKMAARMDRYVIRLRIQDWAVGE